MTAILQVPPIRLEPVAEPTALSLPDDSRRNASTESDVSASLQDYRDLAPEQREKLQSQVSRELVGQYAALLEKALSDPKAAAEFLEFAEKAGTAVSDVFSKFVEERERHYGEPRDQAELSGNKAKHACIDLANKWHALLVKCLADPALRKDLCRAMAQSYVDSVDEVLSRPALTPEELKLVPREQQQQIEKMQMMLHDCRLERERLAAALASGGPEALREAVTKMIDAEEQSLRKLGDISEFQKRTERKALHESREPLRRMARGLGRQGPFGTDGIQVEDVSGEQSRLENAPGETHEAEESMEILLRMQSRLLECMPTMPMRGLPGLILQNGVTHGLLRLAADVIED